MSRGDLSRQLSRAWFRSREAARGLRALEVRVREIVGDAAFREAPGIKAALDEMSEAERRFEAAVDAPEVTIATTGTTSGGKSTMMNFLVGAPIMPVSVDEMSAGLVSILHDPGQRSVTIEATKGATWEDGHWEGLADSEIERRLRVTMDAWRGARARGQNLPAPIVTVRYPTRLGAAPEVLGLPSTTRVRLLDLPGLNSLADQANAEVIRAGSRRALCLVLYNSDDTDALKQKALLDQVVEQVKQLRGSPARMLFILNRIDAFRRDADWQARQDGFTERITIGIRESISQGLGQEHAGAAQSIRPQVFSSGPAALAVQARQSVGPEQDALLSAIEAKYGNLLDRELLSSYPRSPSSWTAGQRAVFLSAVEEAAHAPALERRLAGHIAEHLPELILPHLIGDVAQPARRVLLDLDGIVNAYRLRSTAALNAEKADLERVHDRLASLRDEVLALVAPFRALDPEADQDALRVQLQNAAVTISASLAIDVDQLAPLRDFGLMFTHRVESLFEPIIGVTGAEWPEILSTERRDRLVGALNELRLGDAGPALGRGGKLRADEAAVTRVVNQLRAFGAALADATNELVDRESETQADRVKNSLAGVLQVVAGMVAETAERERPQLAGLRGAPPVVGWMEAPPNAGLSFDPRIEKWKHTYDLSKEVKVGTKRLWYTFWLKKVDVYETQKYQVTEHGCDIPALAMLLGSFQETAQLDRYGRSHAKHIIRQIAVFDKALSSHYREVLDRYGRHLQSAFADVGRRSDEERAKLDVLVPELDGVANAIGAAEEWR